MDKKTYGHPIIAQILNENYYPVKFNAEEKKTLKFLEEHFPILIQNIKEEIHYMNLQYMNVGAVPSTVFLDETVIPSPFSGRIVCQRTGTLS
jgi:hypothetical protein